jgi:hypothetical protein
VTNKKLYGICLGKVKDGKWEIPPDTIPLSTKNGDKDVKVRFLKNNEIFDCTVYMIQYRIEKFKAFKETGYDFEFVVINSDYNKIEGETNHKINVHYEEFNNLD